MDLSSSIDVLIKSAEADDDGDLEGKNGPMYLTDKSFAEFTKDGLHFVNFYVPWSQPYRQLSSTWYDLAQSFHQSGDTVFISEVSVYGLCAVYVSYLNSIHALLFAISVSCVLCYCMSSDTGGIRYLDFYLSF